MENNSDLLHSLKETMKVVRDTSWLRNTPHYWATASLPLAYAVACVEVVSKNSEKAKAIYQQIIESWGKTGIKAISDEVFSLVPKSEIEKMKNALLHPEAELLPDPNKPFRKLEEMFAGIEINEDFFKDENIDNLSPEQQKEVQEFAELACLILEFTIIGFNRETDIEKRRYRVIPTEKGTWLILAVMLRTSAENYNITLEGLRNFFKVREYKGKTIDFHKVLAEQPMSRLHRRMIASGKAVKLKLKNDKVIIDAARAWYQCRVKYSSVSKYCDALSKKGVILDPKNLEKKIRPCDDAVGYIRRLPRKAIK